MLSIARNILAQPNYTVYRRKTGQPVQVKLCPLNLVPRAALAEWKNHVDVEHSATEKHHGWQLPLDPQQDFRDAQIDHQLRGFPSVIGLVEEDLSHLHGFFTLNIAWPAKLGSIYTAPFNYAALKDEAAVNKVDPEIMNEPWIQTPFHDAIAVKRTGWVMMGLATAYTYLLTELDLAVFPIRGYLLSDTEPEKFYTDVIGATCGNNELDFSQEQAEAFLRRVKQGL